MVKVTAEGTLHAQMDIKLNKLLNFLASSKYSSTYIDEDERGELK